MVRSTSLLLAGLALVGGGVAVLYSDLPVRWWLGVTLLVAGLLAKIGGFLLTDQPDPVRAAGRTSSTRNGRHGESAGVRVTSGPVVRAMPARVRARSTPSWRPTRRAS